MLLEDIKNYIPAITAKWIPKDTCLQLLCYLGDILLLSTTRNILRERKKEKAMGYSRYLNSILEVDLYVSALVRCCNNSLFWWRGGVPTYYFAKFSKKRKRKKSCMKLRKFWAVQGARANPPDPPMLQLIRRVLDW